MTPSIAWRRTWKRRTRGLVAWLGLLACLAPWPAVARAQTIAASVRDLKELSLDELFDLEITTVSRRAEKLSRAASAIQVIPGEDIRHAGATTLAEALRLATNLQVSQVSSSEWSISARGFSGAPLPTTSLANKLLVMIDGRTVYTPLFGGVFWDVQHVLLEDVSHIEVVSGPGGTLWGANAVNGVINVVTRSAHETQGVFVGGAAGTWLRDFAAVRYGGAAGASGAYRVYAQRLDVNETLRADGEGAGDEWGLLQGGFRVDLAPRRFETLTLQGDVYGGVYGDPTGSRTNGQNLIARYGREEPGGAGLMLQLVADRAWRTLSGGFEEDLRVLDLDFQHHFPLSPRQQLLWGFGARVTHDDVSDSDVQQFDPARRTLRLASGFVQDDIVVVPERLQGSFGIKLEHNSYSGLEVQPSARLSLLLGPRHTVWTAVSRAVRSPSRFDTDVLIPLAGDPDFASERLLALEAGWRVTPLPRLSMSVAAFRNRYDDLRGIRVVSVAPPAFAFDNVQEGQTTGAEVTAVWQAAPWARLRAGYTYYHARITATAPDVLPGSDLFEGIDPRHQALAHGRFDLPRGAEFDVLARWVDALPASLVTPPVASYVTMDGRLGQRFGDVELAIVGRNLAEARHVEFGSRQHPRSVHASLGWRF